MSQQDEVMTLKETADFLKVSPLTIRKIMKEAKLPGHRMGRKWIFLRSEIIDWIKEKK